MKWRFYFLFTAFTFLFLFYPGDSYFFNIFADNRQLFSSEQKKDKSLPILPVAYTTSNTAPEISAEGAYIVDLPSFTPLYEKNADMKLLPASTTKVITALVAYDVYQPDDIITIKKVMTEGQTMGLQVGERITVENLFYGMLVYSGNDAAFAFADNYGFDKFIDLMNKKAADLGMKNSHFQNPAGLDSSMQYSTAHDLALAGRALLRNKMLSKIVSIKEITISDVDFKIFHRLTNVNKLLGEIQGLGGLKTGYTENAGENLISFYKNDGHQFVTVVLKSADRFADTRNIVQWIDTNVQYLDPASQSIPD